jgi:hypothetical protein
VIPYTDNSAHVEDDFCTERRLKETLAFIRPEDMRGRVLDIGEPNYALQRIEHAFPAARCSSGYGFDLNRRGFNDGAVGVRAVVCFEVFEHVMNPLFLLDNIAMVLNRGGVLYLSTPVHNRFGFMFNETCHFAEYKVEAVKTCLEYSGFKVTDTHLFKSIPFWRGMKHGGGLFRTALRVGSQYTQIHRAVKI